MARTTYALLFLISVQVAWVQGATWGYTGSIGPTYWSSLGNPLCSGTEQSPIDITAGDALQDSSLGTFTLTGYDTNPTSLTFTNNGHTATVAVVGSIQLSGGGLSASSYNLAQFHFHWGSDKNQGSEHTVDGKQYPMELHLVHYSSVHPDLSTAAAVTSPRGLAVLGFFFEIDTADNTALDPIVNKLSSIVYDGNSVAVPVFPLADILPITSRLSEYYRYNGSLTTPTCNPSVEWTVFKETIKISETQLAAFRGIKFADNTTQQNNYRPVQSLGARQVLSTVNSAGLAQPQALLIATLSAAMLLFYKDC